MSQAKDEARFGRLCLLSLNTCSAILRGVIDNSYSPAIYNFETFLTSKIHTLFHLKFRRCCCRSGRSNNTPLTAPQWDSLFTRVTTANCHHGYTGECPCQYRAITGVTTDVLDVTLCCLFLTNLCPNIPQADVNTIRQVRNELIHTNTARVDEPTFYTHWNRIEQALLNLSNTVSPVFTNETRIALPTLKDRVIDPAELDALKTLMTDHRDYDSLKQVRSRSLFDQTQHGYKWFNINTYSKFGFPSFTLKFIEIDKWLLTVRKLLTSQWRF